MKLSYGQDESIPRYGLVKRILYFTSWMKFFLKGCALLCCRVILHILMVGILYKCMNYFWYYRGRSGLSYWFITNSQESVKAQCSRFLGATICFHRQKWCLSFVLSIYYFWDTYPVIFLDLTICFSFLWTGKKSRHLAEKSLKEINSYARFILFFFIGYASDRQESGRVVLPLNVLALKWFQLSAFDISRKGCMDLDGSGLRIETTDKQLLFLFT